MLDPSVLYNQKILLQVHLLYMYLVQKLWYVNPTIIIQ